MARWSIRILVRQSPPLPPVKNTSFYKSANFHDGFKQGLDFKFLIALLKDFHTTFKIIIVRKKEFKSNWSEHFFISPTDLLSIFGFLSIKSFFNS